MVIKCVHACRLQRRTERPWIRDETKEEENTLKRVEAVVQPVNTSQSPLTPVFDDLQSGNNVLKMRFLLVKPLTGLQVLLCYSIEAFFMYLYFTSVRLIGDAIP